MRVAAYRARIAAGWRPQAPVAPYPSGEIFGSPTGSAKPTGVCDLLLFGWMPHRVEGVPDWHANPLDPEGRIDSSLEWPDALLALSGRDAKPFWELSRFCWMPQWALDARNGDRTALMRLNTWAADWILQNPPYRGINWSCGQEAAIRVMHLAISQLILGEKMPPTPKLAWLVEVSAKRIRPTLSYAVGQDNNHGSAEACALFIAGTWGQLWKMPDADNIAKLGRRWLENRALRLIQSDGSPCQYSTTYHRANLETYCVAELWRRSIRAEPFPSEILKRISDGARWLHQLTDPTSGDAPNIGANDGSHLFNLPKTPFRDFRPTISLAARLFDGANAYPGADFLDKRADLFGLSAATCEWTVPSGKSYDEGGFHVLRAGSATAVMRYPQFKFRPSQADALHLDLWVKGCNVLRDAGTFSYTTTDSEWFSSTAAHNTVEFDDRNQMPKLSRFLFGDWLSADVIEPVIKTSQDSQAAAGYTDRYGGRHIRRVYLAENSLKVLDEVSGFARKAVLRWRLAPGDWAVNTIDGFAHVLHCAKYPTFKLTVSATGGRQRCDLVAGWESRHYLEKTHVPVLELEVSSACTITTHLAWAQ